jgi:hypothetical protein
MHRSVEITADDSGRGSLGQKRSTHTREVVLQLLHGLVDSSEGRQDGSTLTPVG